MISNSLDIDFIHGDIHGQSFKKYEYIAYLVYVILAHTLLFMASYAAMGYAKECKLTVYHLIYSHSCILLKCAYILKYLWIYIIRLATYLVITLLGHYYFVPIPVE